MNQVNPPQRMVRRRFVFLAAAGGAAAVVSTCLSGKRSSSTTATDFAPGTALFQNSAFAVDRRSDGLTISTTTATGQRIAFRVDADAKVLWDQIPTLVQHQAGRKITVAKLLDLAANKVRGRDPTVVRREAQAFLREALRGNLILKPGGRIALFRKTSNSA